MKTLNDDQLKYIELYGWNISSMRNKWYLRFYVELGKEQLSVASYDLEDGSLKLRYELPYNAIEMIYVRIERLNDWRDKR